VVAVVGGEDGAIGGDVDAVRPHGEVTLAPGAQEIAMPVVDDHRVFATADQKYAIFLIDRDTGHIPMCKALRQLLPVGNYLVVDLIGHAALPFACHAKPPLPCDRSALANPSITPTRPCCKSHQANGARRHR
jgi:hypothetical protein